MNDFNKTHNSPQNAWVVFSGHTDLAWLKILKPGYRHCSLIFKQNDQWISYDPLSNYSELTVHQLPPDFNLPRWMEARGFKVLPATMVKPPKPAPIGLYSCVEAVKRMLGIHACFVLTPWQLYRYLDRQSHQHLNLTGDLVWEV